MTIYMYFTLVVTQTEYPVANTEIGLNPNNSVIKKVMVSE